MPRGKLRFSFQVSFMFRAPLLLVITLLWTQCALAQIERGDTDKGGSRLGDRRVSHYRVGARITAANGPCRDVLVMVAVPFECDEQDVQVVTEDISPLVSSVKYRSVSGGARQMLISIPAMSRNQTAHALITFEVATHKIRPPESTADLVVPTRPKRDLRKFLGPSPHIESKNKDIRKLAREIAKRETAGMSDWKKVEAIYDHVLDSIEYIEGPDKSAIHTLRDGHADCQGRSALFIALCRASKIPARMVWVHGHCYPEFYLEDESQEGHWFPCESAGSRAFGEMPLARTILQKGDRFTVPERPRERLRYASDFTIGRPAPGGGKPSVKYVREQM